MAYTETGITHKGIKRMEFLRKLEIASFILTLIALYLISIPSIWTFPVFLVSFAVQMVIFKRIGQTFLFYQMIVLFIFNAYNIYSWWSKGIG